MRARLAAIACAVMIAFSAVANAAEQGVFALEDDPTTGALRAALDGREIFVYRYGPNIDLPHFWPLNTPSGKNLLVQETNPYPHHRSFWVSDTVERDGVRGDIYNGYYSGVKLGAKKHGPPFNTGVKHVSFSLTTGTQGRATIVEKLTWETSRTTGAFPMLDEERQIELRSLGNGEYLMDFSFTLRATYGDVKFVSDAVHYAWPYLRMNPQFNATSGGVITSDTGTTGQLATNLKPAKWIDFSGAVNKEAEGVAMFQWPQGATPLWLTRDYGTFGPRRPEHQSGKPFTVPKGETLSQRVGILVHRGDVKAGKVAERYEWFVKGGSE